MAVTQPLTLPLPTASDADPLPEADRAPLPLAVTDAHPDPVTDVVVEEVGVGHVEDRGVCVTAGVPDAQGHVVCETEGGAEPDREAEAHGVEVWVAQKVGFSVSAAEMLPEALMHAVLLALPVDDKHRVVEGDEVALCVSAATVAEAHTEPVPLPLAPPLDAVPHALPKKLPEVDPL